MQKSFLTIIAMSSASEYGIYKAFFLANPLGIIMPQLEIQTNKLNFRGE